MQSLANRVVIMHITDSFVANPLKGGDAKPPVYGIGVFQNALMAG